MIRNITTMKKIIALLLLVALSAFSQTIDDARKAQAEKRFEEAIRIAKPLAESGNPDAQFMVGMSYVNGLGVQRNPQEGSSWLHKAAGANHMNAQAVLGTMYFRGDGVEKDYFVSLQMRKKAAEKGQLNAAYEVAQMATNGQGTERNIALAKSYYQQILGSQNTTPNGIQVKEKARQALNELSNSTPSAQLQVAPSAKTTPNTNQQTNGADELTRMKQELETLKLKKEIEDLKKQMAEKDAVDANKERMRNEMPNCIQEAKNAGSICGLSCFQGAQFAVNQQCAQTCADRQQMYIDRCRSIK